MGNDPAGRIIVMTLQEMRERKKERGLTNEMIAERSGVPLGTVQKIFAGITKSPRWDTMQALERVLSPALENTTCKERPGKVPQASYADRYGNSVQPGSVVREAETAYSINKGQGNYTYEDYLAIPDDRRVELIDGYIYDMASAIPVHQAILGELYVQLYACVDGHPECELFLAPSDVKIDSDDRTVVQPDLYIICDRKDPSNKIINGAPDFIVEILSPSNRSHDLFLKLNKYHGSGVREYWIVDPEKLKVIVYDLEHDDLPVVYEFSDTVPVGISGGKCVVDFARIYAKVKRYL